MTQPFDDEHGDRLRRALHAEAEAVTPSPEGLERIRTKINQRGERRLGFFPFSAPWLRPLAAVAAAVVVCVTAVSVTPALANFVQTGHFSTSAGDRDKTTGNDGTSVGQVPPSGSVTPGPSVPTTPRPHPSGSGKHVVSGSCDPGEKTVTPPGSPPPDPSGATPPTVTCQPTTAPGNPGVPPTSAPPEAPPPPATTPPEEAPPSDQPTSEIGPTVAPNASP